MTGYAKVCLGLLITTMCLDSVKAQNAEISAQELQLRETMRTLWTDHIVWIYGYVAAELSGSGNPKLIFDRLFDNQTDIGQALIPYFGKTATTTLTNLLKEHITGLKELVSGIKKNDSSKKKTADKKWQKNADDLVAFLSKTNKSWAKNDLSDMFDKHLEDIKSLITIRQKEEWSKDIKAYDEARSHMLDMADMFSDGIVKQFPKKF